jgi:hypothetical protein
MLKILGMNFQHTNDKDIGMYVHGSDLQLYKKDVQSTWYLSKCTKIKFDKNISTDTTWKYNIYRLQNLSSYRKILHKETFFLSMTEKKGKHERTIARL